MASLISRPNRNYWVQWKLNDKKFTLRLGKIDLRSAQEVLRRVESLCTSRLAGVQPDEATTVWLTRLDSTIAKRLASTGLIDERQVRTLGELMDYVWSQLDVKESTQQSYAHVRRNLLEFFGADRQIERITPGDADEFVRWLRPRVAAATTSGRSRRARQFFGYAVKKRWITTNPFADQRFGTQENRERMFFVPADWVRAIIQELTDDEFRLIVALARWGGLRVPSEPLILTWNDVDWSQATMRVKAPKTGQTRIVPIFPEIRPYLERLWDQAGSSQYVISRHRATGQAITSAVVRAIGRCGIPVWPKLFQNLRSTRETELAETYPIHVVCQWIGNSPRIAARHYLQVTEDHLRRAKGEATGEAKCESSSTADSGVSRYQVAHRAVPECVVHRESRPKLPADGRSERGEVGDTGPSAVR